MRVHPLALAFAAAAVHAGRAATRRALALVLPTLAVVLPVLALACGGRAGDAHLVRANDNREPAGRLRGGVLTVRLDVVRAEWRPEADSGPGAVVAAFAETGRAPQVPGPLLRVPTGTTIAATVTNALPDSTVTVFGLVARPADSAARVGVAIPPGQSRELRFAAGASGTYLYWGRVGVQSDSVEREQLAGAFVVDSAAGPHRDRVFVMNIWGSPVDSTTYRNALAINGRSFPYNQRVQATVGDTLRWRVINATLRPHPMHLHGFYYTIGAAGDPWGDTVYAPADRRLVVTETMRPGHTMDLAWTPDRDGNWLFHCHITFHVAPPFARFTPSAPGDTGMASQTMSHDPRLHMAGLALGITVRPPRGYRAPAREAPRALRLLVQEGRRRLHAARALGYVLQRGVDPARDSVEIPGSVLVLTRGEPTDITVVNRLREPTGVHWHGIELESYSDGVVGWSGSGERLAPRIAPGDSFTAHLTLPRAGTFIYHTHLNDYEQLTSGLYGAIVVLERGRTLDPATDHVLVAGWDGTAGPPWVVVNGDGAPPPLVLVSGVTHRFRLVNIGSAGRLGFKLEPAGASVSWRRVAKDGADLPPSQVREHAAEERLDVGETMDVELAPPPGRYRLTVGYGLPAADLEPRGGGAVVSAARC